MRCRTSFLFGMTVLAMGMAIPQRGNALDGGVPAFLPVGEIADAPAGFIDMCVQDPVLCQLGEDPQMAQLALRAETPSPDPAAAEEPIGMTGAILPAQDNRREGRVLVTVTAYPPALPQDQERKRLFKILKQINAQVNRGVQPLTDRQAFGVDELWRRPPGSRPVGDCEDFAIEKRYRLTALGFPAARLFYAAVYHPRAGLHTVLIARLDDGDYILDNMSPHILHWSKARFVWLRQQMSGQPTIWARIPDWKAMQDPASIAPASRLAHKPPEGEIAS